MKPWLVRGLALAAAMVVLRLVQTVLINTFETRARLISLALLVIFAVVVLVWGYADGRADARAHSDPDRRADLAMRWLLGGLLAGALSGFVTWLVSLFYTGVYAEGLLIEISTFAAFVALLIFLPAAAGVAAGRILVDRKQTDEPRQRDGDSDGDGENTDTDVFAAVRDRDGDGDGKDRERTDRGDGARSDEPQTAEDSAR